MSKARAFQAQWRAWAWAKLRKTEPRLEPRTFEPEPEPWAWHWIEVLVNEIKENYILFNSNKLSFISDIKWVNYSELKYLNIDSEHIKVWIESFESVSHFWYDFTTIFAQFS